MPDSGPSAGLGTSGMNGVAPLFHRTCFGRDSGEAQAPSDRQPSPANSVRSNQTTGLPLRRNRPAPARRSGEEPGRAGGIGATSERTGQIWRRERLRPRGRSACRTTRAAPGKPRAAATATAADSGGTTPPSRPRRLTDGRRPPISAPELRRLRRPEPSPYFSNRSRLSSRSSGHRRRAPSQRRCWVPGRRSGRDKPRRQDP